MTWFLTFGYTHPLRDGWIEVEAATYSAARKLVFDQFGRIWSNLYKEGEFDEKNFPLGRIGEVLK